MKKKGKSGGKSKSISLHPLKPEEALKDLLNTPFKSKRKNKLTGIEKKKA